MLKEKCYPFTQKGMSECFKRKSCITSTKEVLENHIELLPVALLLVISVSTLRVFIFNGEIQG